MYGSSRVVSICLACAFFFHPIVLPSKQFYACLLSTFSPFTLVITIPLILHVLVFSLGNALLYGIYAMRHPFFEQFKVIKKPWPWTIDEQRGDYRKLISRSLQSIAINQLIICPILAIFSYDNYSKMLKSSLEHFPNWYTIPLQILACMVIDDTMFYWSHRLLHHPFFYRFHKQHHEYKTTIGIASENSSPIDYIFSSLLPFSVPPLLLGLHCYTFWMYLIWRLGETIDGHSGYDWPISPYRWIPMSGSATVHDFHHSHSLGNYGGMFVWWDKLMGTDADYQTFLEKKKSN